MYLLNTHVWEFTFNQVLPPKTNHSLNSIFCHSKILRPESKIILPSSNVVQKTVPLPIYATKTTVTSLFLTICPDLFHVSVSQFILSTTLATLVKLQGKRTALWSTLIIQKKFKQFQSCAAYPNINAALASLSQKSFLVQLIELLSPISLIQ